MVALLNFVGGAGIPLSNSEGGPGVPLLNFRGSRFSGSCSHFYTIPSQYTHVFLFVSLTVIDPVDRLFLSDPVTSFFMFLFKFIPVSIQFSQSIFKFLS